jgi:hypothetical protein
MPESITGRLNLSEREVYKHLTASVSIDICIKRDWRVRIGALLVKIGFRMMGISEESKIIDIMGKSVHSVEACDEHG